MNAENTADEQPAPAGITRSSKFYWDTVVFRVQDTVFAVPRRAFTDSSPVFETMFLLPTREGCSGVEGGSDDYPIVLEGYNAAEFDALLTVLYPTSQALVSGGVTLSKEQWISVLKLATIWEMGDIRDLAIKTLSSMSLTAVEKVTHGRDFKLSSWLIEGLMTLTWDDRQLSPDDLAEAVGLRTAFRIYTARLRQPSNHAKLRPVSVPSGLRIGIAIGDLLCNSCYKPVFLNEFASCQSCSSARVVSECGSVYIGQTVVQTTVAECYLGNVHSNMRCASCHQAFITRNITCPHCSSAAGLWLLLGKLTPSILSTESVIRDVFQDEIRECEG